MKIQVWSEYFKLWENTGFKRLDDVIPFLTVCGIATKDIKRSPTRLKFKMKYLDMKPWSVMLYQAVTK